MGPSYGHGYDCAGFFEATNFAPQPWQIGEFGEISE
jgi:hypothetical protein